MTKPKTATLYLRVRTDTKQAFAAKAEVHSTVSDVLRELVLAYVEGRVTVTPRSII